MTPLAQPRHDLAAGFAAHAAQWAQAAGAPAHALPALREAAWRLALATADGHVCLPLDLLADDSQADDDEARTVLRQRLLASGIVADAASMDHATAHPLVLDAAGRLYLRRHFDLECRLAGRLRALAAQPAIQTADAMQTAAGDDDLRARLDTFFPPRAATAQGETAPDWQKLAAALALHNRLTLISGGPGSGKTTTVAALLGCLLAREPGLRIALAAPTGKAAARMLEALRQRAAALPVELRARLPEVAHTVHRLLGVTAEPGRFRHNADNPLAVDVLVIDEASMLDLALATRLLDAVPPGARLILLGDKDQLAAVEAGAVFSELTAVCGFRAATAQRLAALAGVPEAVLPKLAGESAPLADCVVWLAGSHRFARDSGIGRLAADINAGEGARALGWLRAGRDPAATWIDDDAPRPGAATLARLEAGYADYIAAIATLRGSAASASDARQAFAAFDRFRALAAVHNGPRGVAALNGHMERTLRAALAHPPGRGAASPWYPGRPVIVRRNDPALGLYNGDTGLCLMENGRLAVFFPAAGGGCRAIAPTRLPAHDTAFVLTAHKSQGSEFDHVLFVLPGSVQRVLTRELLYTAVTRAARHVTLAGSAAVFTAACATPVRRFSGLGARLAEVGETAV